MSIGIKTNKKDNSRRKFRGGGPRADLNKIKRDEARERQEAWSKFTPEQQIAELNRRLGPGLGARKQRARLFRLIESKENKQVAPTKRSK